MSPGVADNEHQPLLAPAESSGKTNDVRNKLRRTVIFIIFVSLFLLVVGMCMDLAPQTAIWETIICKQHYDDHTLAGTALPLDSLDCKIEPVQSRLARLSGWKDTLDQLSGIFLAVPYGLMADRHGRKPVFLLGLIGLVLQSVALKLIAWFPQYLPLWLVWVSPALLFIGGGARVIISMLFTMLSDVSTPDERTKLFSHVIMLFLLAQVVSMTGTAAVAERFGPWLPYLSSISTYVVGLVLVYFMPETQNMFHAKTVPNSAIPNATGETLPATKKALWNFQANIYNAATFLQRNASVCILVASTFVGVLSQPAIGLLLIYIPRRFPPWTIAQASTFVSFRGFLYLLLLAGGMPFITYIFHRRMGISQAVLDLRLAQLSAFFIGAGSCMIGLAPQVSLVVVGLVVVSLGSAVELFIRSLATTFVSPDNVASLFTTMAVVESLGLCIISPVLAALFRWGMLLGTNWQGLPFLVVGVLFAASAFALLFVRLPKNGETEIPPEENISEVLIQQEMHV